MSTFSLTEFQTCEKGLSDGLQTLGLKLNLLDQAIVGFKGSPWIPDVLEEPIKEAGRAIWDALKKVYETIKDLVASIWAPVTLYQRSTDWTDLRSVSSAVEADLTPEALSTDTLWYGSAAEAYRKVIPLQQSATSWVSTAEDTLSSSLLSTAAAGLVFYLALAALLVKLIAAAVAAIAAFGSAVFSWAGLLIILEEVGVDSLTVMILVAELTSYIAGEWTGKSGISSVTSDNSSFPGASNGERLWPRGATESYSDATVTDGTASWSIEDPA